MGTSEIGSESIPRLPGLTALDASTAGDAEKIQGGLLRYGEALLAAPYRAVGPREIGRVLNEIVLDSLAPAVLGLLPDGSDALVIDLGSGSGIPAIPLAFLLPSPRLVAVDSSTKRIAYARDFARSEGLLRLSFLAVHIAVFGSRHHGVRRTSIPPAEVQQYLGHADAVVSRGCAKLPETLTLSVAFLKPGGRVLVYTTPRAADEFVPQAEAAMSGVWSFHRHPYRRPSGDEEYLILECAPSAA
jgi:16S rRNA G527 N7-methylase RsmG